uniref:SOCS box domain-containing protein n=1 Tax=Trichogramma kaykai TaxID=54128 RepID=A0ABD2XEF0_9HYME
MWWSEENSFSQLPSSPQSADDAFCIEEGEIAYYDFQKMDNLQKLEILKNARKKVNWYNAIERSVFLRELYPVLNHWNYELPDLRDIFQKKDIEDLLKDAVYDKYNRYKGDQFIHFVASTDYKHEPDVDQNGKPLLKHTTALHVAARSIPKRDHPYSYIKVSDLFKIYDRYDLNYTNVDGLTHFHVACKFNCYDVVEKFLELGQDPNCVWPITGDSPLHVAVNAGHKKVVELLLKNGADPNLANIYGSTPLHIICYSDDHYQIDFEDCNKGNNEYRKLAELLFKINDEMQQTVQVDALDKKGRTPLQRAVAHLKLELVDLLLDRGADLSSFVFPDKYDFCECTERRKKSSIYFKLRLACDTLDVVERLKTRGYELKQSEVQTIMADFDDRAMFGKSEDLEKCWHKDERFTWVTKIMMIKPNLSLYDVIRLRPEEAAKLLTYKDYFKFEYVDERRYFPVCEFHPLEIMLRRFCRRRSVEPFMELTRHRLPILCCEMILNLLMNQDLCNVCLASAVQSRYFM